jgi:hypothetical protein
MHIQLCIPLNVLTFTGLMNEGSCLAIDKIIINYSEILSSPPSLLPHCVPLIIKHILLLGETVHEPSIT